MSQSQLSYFVKNIFLYFSIILVSFYCLFHATFAATHSSHHVTQYTKKKKVAQKKNRKKVTASKKQTISRKKQQIVSYKRPAPVPTTPVISSPGFDQQYRRFLNRWQIPGSSVVILKNGQFILARGYGWADVKNQRPMTPDSVFRVASVSKAITAVATLKLVQDGKLRLDSKVYDILSDLRPLTNSAPNSRIYSIRVRHLLEMSSGWITDRGIDPMLGAWSYNMRKQLNQQIPPDCRNAARLMMTMPMQYAPGTQYSYSNLNYCMLGLIINKLSGKTGANGYQAYVKQNIFSPYGITTMRIGDNAPGKQAANEVHYYFRETSVNVGRIRDGLPYGQTRLLEKNFSDGGWIASAPDLAKFLQALSRHQILNSTMVSTMTARPAFQHNPYQYFAKGWHVKWIKGRWFMLKTGSFTGTQALVMLEENGTAYVALFNAKPSNRRTFLPQLQNMLIAYAQGR